MVLKKTLLTLPNFRHGKYRGYSLIEIIGVLLMMGVLTAVAIPTIFHNNQLRDTVSQTKQIFNVARSRAMATTSAIRIKVDSANSPPKLIVENAVTRGCEATTQLSVNANSADTDLTVFSTSGFVVGDNLKIGNDDDNNQILAIDSVNSIITLGDNIGTNQTVNTTVELANNWSSDASLPVDDLTLAKDIEITANVTDWTLCFNSRGIAYVYDASGVINQNLVLTFTDSKSNDSETLTILTGGAILRN